MNVELLFVSPKHLVLKGIRTCWQTQEKSDTDPTTDTLGENDKQLLKKIIDLGHSSTLEHSLITYQVNGISRALLQELSRHRVGVSPSVESSRFTFKKILRNQESVEHVLISSGDEDLDDLNKEHMEKVKELANNKNLPNDICKYGLVETYKVNEIISFNFRSLRHFYQLRSSKKALWEIRELANSFIEQLPESYSVFFEDLK